jgi:hypothetical protein
LCYAQGYSTQFFSVASFLWTTTIAFTLHRTVVKHKVDVEGFGLYFHGYVWGKLLISLISSPPKIMLLKFSMSFLVLFFSIFSPSFSCPFFLISFSLMFCWACHHHAQSSPHSWSCDRNSVSWLMYDIGPQPLPGADKVSGCYCSFSLPYMLLMKILNMNVAVPIAQLAPQLVLYFLGFEVSSSPVHQYTFLSVIIFTLLSSHLSILFRLT